MAAARLWWLLKWAGHDAVAVLDGGFAAWQSANLPTTAGYQSVADKVFVGHFRPELVISTDELHAASTNSMCVIDSRASDRYRGENETIDHIAGHIPGALSMPFTENTTLNGKFRSREELMARFDDVRKTESECPVVFYCGSGVTAAHNVLAYTYTYSDVPRLYAGSWSEWINDSGRPIATGQERL
jgi:thiosulfate/3-mercaptopyruvate sulfurtransferase